MLSVEAGIQAESGIANLDHGLEVVKDQGIVNVTGVLSESIRNNLASLATMVGLGMADHVPGIGEGVQLHGVSVRQLAVADAPPLLQEVLVATQEQILTFAGGDLPGWQPTARKAGARVVSMLDEAVFQPHTDNYEGLVASLQIGVEGKKVMVVETDQGWEQTEVRTGDVTLFAGDTFSEKSRRVHGFKFSGLYAVAITLGQDPFYTISGRYPLVERNPHLAELEH